MKSYRYLLTIILVCSFVSNSLAQPYCIDCFSNVVGPDLYRKQRTDNGQMDNVVTVKIGDEWKVNGQYPPKLLGAVVNALATWNSQDPTGPRIQLDNDAPDDKVSVKIGKKNLPLGVLARAVPNLVGSVKSSGTMILNLDPVNLIATTIGEVDLSGRIAHEIGHNVKGITHNLCAGTGPPSIMSDPNPDGSRDINTVQGADVAAAIKFRQNKANCLETGPVPTKIEDFQDGGGGDIVTDPPYQEPRSQGGCIELWEYTNVYICYDGCRYIGTIFRRISPACPELED